MSPQELREHVGRLFHHYQSGDQDTVLTLIELQRPALFDYAFRMSGQRDASIKVLDEVASAIFSEDPAQFSSFEEFQTRLFATMRSFASHIWNADTSQLVNEGYENLDYESLDPALNDFIIRRVETSLGALPTWEKEPLLLKARVGLSVEMIAEVVSLNAQGVQDGMNNAYIKIAQVCQIDPGLIDKAIAAIPDHPLTGGSMNTTAALSQIMGDIEQSRGKISKTRLVFGLAFLSGVIGLGIYVALNYRHFIP